MLKILVLLVLYFFAPALESEAESFKYLDQSPYPQVRELILSFELDSARLLVLKPEKDNYREAVRLFYLSQLDTWNYLLTESPESYNQFEKSHDKADEATSEFDVSAEFLFLNGELHFWKTIAELRKGELISAVWSGNKAYSKYEDAAELRPDNPDILKGIGLLHYLVGVVPSKFSWIVSVFGFSGTMKQGLSELETAARHGNYSKTEAQFFIGALKLFIDRDSKGCLEDLKSITEKYPENGIFILMTGVALQRDRQVKEAAVLYESNLHLFNKKLPAFSGLIKIRLGECRFFLNDFKAAEKILSEFIAEYKGETLKAIACYRLGISQELLGKHEEAKKSFLQMKPRENFEFELYSKAESQKYLTRPMNQAEKELWIAKNNFDCGKFQLSISQGENILTLSGYDEEVRSELIYRLGRMYEETGQLEKAMDYYTKAQELKPKINTWVGAFSLFQQGKIFVKQKRLKEANIKFREAADYGSHAFETSLAREIDTETKKLNG